MFTFPNLHRSLALVHTQQIHVCVLLNGKKFCVTFCRGCFCNSNDSGVDVNEEHFKKMAGNVTEGQRHDEGRGGRTITGIHKSVMRNRIIGAPVC